ncbi:MAG: branched-chain amino acid ABC transporter permease [Clostridia bacterium]|nr:branched-chain amino acid ABC transporter permease [Clostridia bacterium]
MIVTWQTIISLAAVLAAIFAILRYYNKGYDWVKTQEKQEAEIKIIKEEQQILTYGVLACLKGLHEQGCNDSVTDAIAKIEKHLNERAHT